MPSTSPAQHRAMEAAAHGHSTLGIPRKVGQEFVHADERKADHGKHERGEFNAGKCDGAECYSHSRSSYQK